MIPEEFTPLSITDYGKIMIILIMIQWHGYENEIKYVKLSVLVPKI